MEFVVDKVALEQGFLPVCRFSPFSTFPLTRLFAFHSSTSDTILYLLLRVLLHKTSPYLSLSLSNVLTFKFHYLPSAIKPNSLIPSWKGLDILYRKSNELTGRAQMKCDGTRWRTGREVKGKLAIGVGSQYPSHYLGTWCIQHYYHYYHWLGIPRLPVVDWTDAPADLNGLVRFAERRNLVSARVPSHFKRSLPQNIWRYIRGVAQTDVILTGFDCSNILKDFNLCPHKLTSGFRNAGPSVWLLRQSSGLFFFSRFFEWSCRSAKAIRSVDGMGMKFQQWMTVKGRKGKTCPSVSLSTTDPTETHSGFCNDVVRVLVDFNTSLHAIPSTLKMKVACFPESWW